MNWIFKGVMIATVFCCGLLFQTNAQGKINVADVIKATASQYRHAVNEYKDSTKIPRSTKPDGTLFTVDSKDWCSGFFSGSLWLLYDLTKDDFYKKTAIKWSGTIEKEQYNTTTHDIGFKVYIPFGAAYKDTKNVAYKNIIIQSAKSLAKRFHPNVGLIRSWDGNRYNYPVIIDNMMNLELLLEASKFTGDDSYKQIAIKHADKTLDNHFRKNYSSYHVVDYDSLTGTVIKKQTYQGYADESAWARGQAWGLYGYTVMYRYTKEEKYLEQANHIADFILNNPNYPQDGVPFWDFNDPKIPNTYRDASAAAVMASALLELKNYTATEKSKRYFKQAEKILTTLSTPQYLATSGNCNFVLKHCVGNWPKGKAIGEIDASINYGDYYFLEALKRYKESK